MSRDLDHANLGDSLPSRNKHFSGQSVHKIRRFYLHQFQRNLGVVKFWNGSRDPSHAPFRDGRSFEG